MTVYVGECIFPFRQWFMGHMFADTIEELHEMADAIGLKRSWFQDKEGFPHYDITNPKRLAAVRQGAIPLSFEEEADMHAKMDRRGRRKKSGGGKLIDINTGEVLEDNISDIGMRFQAVIDKARQTSETSHLRFGRITCREGRQFISRQRERGVECVFDRMIKNDACILVAGTPEEWDRDLEAL